MQRCVPCSAGTRGGKRSRTDATSPCSSAAASPTSTPKRRSTHSDVSYGWRLSSRPQQPFQPACYNSMSMFRKVLVANRGEIAVRILRGLHELRIPCVAVYSDADRDALHVRMAEEAAYLGPAPSSESYLRIDRIIEAAHRHGADAVHPGYGFLSENSEFAAACEEEGLIFIGPSAQSIRRLGSKTAARQLAKSAGVPVVPGTEEPATDVVRARQLAGELGYPVLL